jgi:peroxiredoxin Q/BCP
VLLSDPDHAVQEAYGVWQQKEKEGEKYMGTVRTTFLIDEAGKIVRIWPNVDVESHIEEVLAAVR